MSWVLWGSELSPFSLKVEALCRFAGLPLRWLPEQAGFLEAQRFAARRRAVVRGRLPLTWPLRTELDEFPAVPFLFGPGGENLYDSSAVGAWLDRERPGDSPLLPTQDPALHFALRLVDEALDELGLYLVHHNRWVVSARDNVAAARLAQEFRPLLGPLVPLFRRWFEARQVRRLPYLFSVAPSSFQAPGLPRRLRPPSRPGFPPTHALLERMFAGLLEALEPVLRTQPFLFGERFTLADASVYGQLSMNRLDASAWAWIRRDAPSVHAWLERLAAGDFSASRPDGALALDADLAPLLRWIATTFVPLMRQNHAAWERHRAAGETRFNEAAFDAGRALYDGELLGLPFRSVVKTFQVRVWLDLRRAWQELDADGRARLEALHPLAQGLGGDSPCH